MSKKTVVQILAEKLDKWPAGADFIVQDASGACWPSKNGVAHCTGGSWHSACIDALRFDLSEVGVDQASAKVTRSEWQAAKAAPQTDIVRARARILEIDTQIQKLSDERDMLMKSIRAEGFYPILPGPQKDIDAGV